MFIPKTLRANATLIALGVLVSGFSFGQNPPVAPVRPVTTDYHGTQVIDNYRYMENLGDPEVEAWMRLQAQYARAQLDAIPGRKDLLQRIHSLLNAEISRSGLCNADGASFMRYLSRELRWPSFITAMG